MAQKVILLQLTLEELAELIGNSVAIELNKTLFTIPKTTSEENLLSIKAAADFLNVSIPTIHTWRKQGLIRAYRIGSSVRFKRSELEEALQ